MQLVERAFAYEGLMDQWAVREPDWKYMRLVPGSRRPQAWATCPFSVPEDKKAVVEFLYDLAGDPGETRDLVDLEPARAAGNPIAETETFAAQPGCKEPYQKAAGGSSLMGWIL